MQRLAPLDATVGPPYGPCVSLWPPPPARRSYALAVSTASVSRITTPAASADLCQASSIPPGLCVDSGPKAMPPVACREHRVAAGVADPQPAHAIALLRTGPPRRWRWRRNAARAAGRSTAGTGPAPGGIRTSNTTGSDSAGTETEDREMSAARELQTFGETLRERVRHKLPVETVMETEIGPVRSLRRKSLRCPGRERRICSFQVRRSARFTGRPAV